MTADTGSTQRLAAILAADEAGTVAAIDAARAVFRHRIETHQG